MTFEERGAVVVVELGDGGEAVGEDVLGGVERPPGYVVEDEVVEADVEGLRDAGKGVEAWGDAAVLITAERRVSLALMTNSIVTPLTGVARFPAPGSELGRLSSIASMSASRRSSWPAMVRCQYVAQRSQRLPASISAHPARRTAGSSRSTGVAVATPL